MAPRYRVALEAAEREELLALTRNGKTPSRVFVSARALLLCDQGPHGPAWTVAELGLEAALRRAPRRRKPRAVTFDGAFEGRLIALACSEAPSGRSRWTVRLLAEKAMELGLAPSISPMTVQRILKKTNSSLT